MKKRAGPERQKASNWTPFVFISLLTLSTQSTATTCHTSRYDQTVSVAEVYDGDTVRLSNNQKLRFIGLNTPERGMDGKADQPFYTQAKKQLQNLIKASNNQLKLVYGKNKYDRHKRLLADVFTIDGKNLTEILIRNGMGYHIAIPPNVTFLTCYKQAEDDAKTQRKGIWSHPFSQAITVNSVSHATQGFQRITGKVKRVGESHSAYWLNLNEHVALRIEKKYLPYFKEHYPKTLLNQNITAQGWIYFRNNEYRMSVKHPASIQIIQ